MNLRARRPALAGISLVEMLVYMSVLMVITGVGFVALYRGMDNSVALRRSGEDIAKAIRAGERWRADVRAATNQIRAETIQEEQVIHLPGAHGLVTYRFTTNRIFRAVGNGAGSPLLSNIQSSAFRSETRHNVIVWQWELELRPNTRKLSRVRPLFTFIAVPAGDARK